MLKEHKNHLKRREMSEKLVEKPVKEGSMDRFEKEDFMEMYQTAIDSGMTSTEFNRTIFEYICSNSVALIDAWDTVVTKIEAINAEEIESDVLKERVLDIIFEQLGEVFPEYKRERG